MQGESKDASLVSKIPSLLGSTSQKGWFLITSICKDLPKDHKEQESGGGRVYVWSRTLMATVAFLVMKDKGDF